MESGVGPLFRRLFAVDIEGASLTAAELIAKISDDLNQAMPSEVTAVETISGVSGELAIGDEVVVRIPGPWDGPVRVVIDLLYSRLQLAKEIQLSMWVRFCLGAADLAGGRARGGVTIRTRVVDQQLWATR